ncbi:MAG TPA: calcium incorporation protein MxaA [Burkholderiales bacterium]|jgi:mxaA protein
MAALRIACAITAVFVATGVYPAAMAVVEQPRPFGYVVGDVMTQRVLLAIDGHELAPAALPKAERVNVWLERRPARIESLPGGHRWLALDYQVINAPQSLTTVNLPAFELRSASDGATLTIAAWPISVNALTSDGSTELRPDRPAPAIATAPIRRQIAVWSSAFLLVLAAWLGWLAWRNWRAAAARPFAHALHEMRYLDGTAPEAWRALHRAFDQTAGRVVQTATLPALFEGVPQLRSLRPEIERFFTQSSELFFGGGLPADRMSARALCAQLRRIERRIER